MGRASQRKQKDWNHPGHANKKRSWTDDEDNQDIPKAGYCSVSIFTTLSLPSKSVASRSILWQKPKRFNSRIHREQEDKGQETLSESVMETSAQDQQSHQDASTREKAKKQNLQE